MNGIYLLLGSNIGNRLEYLREAEKKLIQRGIKVIDESSIYETAPWGPKDQGWFLNIVIQIETSLPAQQLLDTALNVEEEIGRLRKEKWGARSIDIDVLYYHEEVVASEELTIPHRGIPERRFTLIPLVELCPLEIHPVLKKNQMELLANCTDELECKLTEYKL